MTETKTPESTITPPVSSARVAEILKESEQRRTMQAARLGRSSLLNEVPGKIPDVVMRNQEAWHAKENRYHLRKVVAQAEAARQINSVNDGKKARQTLLEQLDQPRFRPIDTTKTTGAGLVEISASSGKPPTPPNLPFEEPPLGGNHEHKRRSRRWRKLIALGAVALAFVGTSFAVRSSSDLSSEKSFRPVPTTASSLKTIAKTKAKHKITKQIAPKAQPPDTIQLDVTAPTPWDAIVKEYGENDAPSIIHKAVADSNGELVEHGEGEKMYITVNGSSSSAEVIKVINRNL